MLSRYFQGRPLGLKSFIEPGGGEEERNTQHLGDDVECKLTFGMDISSRTGWGRKSGVANAPQQPLNGRPVIFSNLKK